MCKLHPVSKTHTDNIYIYICVYSAKKIKKIGSFALFMHFDLNPLSILINERFCLCVCLIDGDMYHTSSDLVTDRRRQIPIYLRLKISIFLLEFVIFFMKLKNWRIPPIFRYCGNFDPFIREMNPNSIFSTNIVNFDLFLINIIRESYSNFFFDYIKSPHSAKNKDFAC